MPKFDFNNNRYARLWTDSDVRFLRSLIDESGLLRTNYGWWKTQFTKASNATPVAADGTATFTVQAKDRTATPMMDMRAPLGDSVPLDYKGISWYSATIPDFIAPGIVETAPQREYKERLFAQFGNDAFLISEWMDDVQMQIDAADQTLTNLGAQLISKGQCSYNFGRGMKGALQKAEIPSENFKKAGTKVWTAADCNLLSQMRTIEVDFRDTKGYNGPMKWQIPYKMYMDVVLKNKEVRELVKQYYTLNDKVFLDSMPVTEEIFNSVVYANYPDLSPIEIVVEKQKDISWDNMTGKFVNGWDSKAAVLRPAGFAGEIQYTDILDVVMFEKYGNNSITKSFAQMEGGIYTLVNTTVPNGMYKEWHTDLIMSAVPSLNEFPYHVIVDTTSANS